MSKVVHTTHFIVKLGVNNEMEIVINLLDLCEVLFLHSTASLALGAVLAGVGEQDLVDYNVVNVNLLLGELDGQSLCFVHAEELRDANGDKGCLSGILELLVDFLDLSLHGVNTVKETLLDVLRVTTFLAHHALHLREHATELVLEFDQLDETFLENVGEVKETKSVTGRGRIENDQREVVLIERLDNLAEGSSFIDTWNRGHKVLHESHRISCGFLVLTLGNSSLSKHTLKESTTATALVSGGVDLHGEEVGEVLDSSGLAGELLIESVRQVVSGISGND